MSLKNQCASNTLFVRVLSLRKVASLLTYNIVVLLLIPAGTMDILYTTCSEERLNTVARLFVIHTRFLFKSKHHFDTTFPIDV